MSGDSKPSVPKGGSAVETDAAWLGLDERSIRLECLRLASRHSNGAAAIRLADEMATFVLRGQSE